MIEVDEDAKEGFCAREGKLGSGVAEDEGVRGLERGGTEGITAGFVEVTVFSEPSDWDLARTGTPSDAGGRNIACNIGSGEGVGGRVLKPDDFIVESHSIEFLI